MNGVTGFKLASVQAVILIEILNQDTAMRSVSQDTRVTKLIKYLERNDTTVVLQFNYNILWFYYNVQGKKRFCF